MPQKFPAYTNRMDDGRRKLSDEDKTFIRVKYGSGASIRSIAHEFHASHGICRRTIQFVLFPERDKKLKEQIIKEKRWNKYYSKDRQREYMQKYRAKKRKILNIPYQKTSKICL